MKYGGLKFLEAAHVKDVLCVLRWAENPRDPIAAFRVLQLLPGVGPASRASALSDRVLDGARSSSCRDLAPLASPPATRRSGRRLST